MGPSRAHIREANMSTENHHMTCCLLSLRSGQCWGITVGAVMALGVEVGQRDRMTLENTE